MNKAYEGHTVRLRRETEERAPVARTIVERTSRVFACLLFATLLLPSACYEALAQETFSFPARSSDLDLSAYWAVREFSEGCCTIDFNVRKYSQSAGKWRGGTGGATNAQDFTWNVPIYAPASGEIASCWRNFPDDPSPGVNPDNNNQIFGGGNHVVIVTGAGNAVSLNHFRSGTIRADLCPPNAGTASFPSTTDKQGDWRVAAYVDPPGRPRVREGEFIGRVGNSGNSSGPHLHVSVQPVTGTDGNGREALGKRQPFRFRQAWGHRYEESDKDTPGGWYRWRGAQFTGDPACPGYQANTPSCGFKMIHASPYLRRHDAGAGTIKQVDPLFLSSSRAVTAVIDSDNKLKLISWSVAGLGRLIRKHDISAGVVKEVRIAEPASNYVLVAVQGAQDELKLIAYAVTATGALVRKAEHTAGPISELEMVETRGPDREVVTAIRDSEGNLKLIAWDLEFTSGGGVSIVRLGQAQAGAVSSLSLTRARNFNGVFTAVRDGENNLKVIPWRLSANGKTITRGNAGGGGEIKQNLSVAALAAGVAAAVRDSDGNLRVITWASSSSGDIDARRDVLVAGKVSEIDLVATPHAGSNLTAVVRDSQGDLRLISLLMDGDGTRLRRAGSSRAGTASRIAAAGVSRSYPPNDPRDMILTALRDSDGNLKLITWDTNLNNP